MYVTEPDKIFEKVVEEKYQNIIVPIFETKSFNCKKFIYDNILVLSKLIIKLNQQLEKIENWDMMRIENYFDIEVNNQLLSNQEVSQISSFFSPIIYEIL